MPSHQLRRAARPAGHRYCMNQLLHLVYHVCRVPFMYYSEARYSRAAPDPQLECRRCLQLQISRCTSATFAISCGNSGPLLIPMLRTRSYEGGENKVPSPLYSGPCEARSLPEVCVSFQFSKPLHASNSRSIYTEGYSYRSATSLLLMTFRISNMLRIPSFGVTVGNLASFSEDRFGPALASCSYQDARWIAV